jgi:hypothetical protein
MTSMVLRNSTLESLTPSANPNTFSDPLWGFVILGLNLNLGPLSLFLFCFFWALLGALFYGVC